MDNTERAANPKNRIIVKGLIISGMILLLLVPTAFIRSLIEERQARQKEATMEVSNKWAGEQSITGPMIVLPYLEQWSDTAGKKFSKRHEAFFLPDELNVTTEISPKERSRGIYKVMLFSSANALEGKFNSISPETLGMNSKNILWNEATVKIHITDPKGLSNELKLKWNDTILTLSPQSSEKGMASKLNLTGFDDLEKISFSAIINLNGSGKIFFSPVGKATTVNMTSKYPHPSFTGNILPVDHSISDSGFKAKWISLSHTRRYPQAWVDDGYDLSIPENDLFVSANSRSGDVIVAASGDKLTLQDLGSASFGVDLFIPVSGYQKTDRSVKYSALCIVLTFCAFFLTELISKRTIHPFQYALVGLALVLFYVLLLSFSEYIDFNLAYAIAAVATVALIAWFIRSILQSGRLTILLTIILTMLYSYVFIILQLHDYALLLGSIGLFISLAAVMYFSRQFNTKVSETSN